MTIAAATSIQFPTSSHGLVNFSEPHVRAEKIFAACCGLSLQAWAAPRNSAIERFIRSNSPVHAGTVHQVSVYRQRRNAQQIVSQFFIGQMCAHKVAPSRARIAPTAR